MEKVVLPGLELRADLHVPRLARKDRQEHVIGQAAGQALVQHVVPVGQHLGLVGRQAHQPAAGEEARARAPAHQATATFVITPTRGLMPPDTVVTADLLHEFASVDVAADNERYRVPLERDLQMLAERLPADVRVVLLGSIASDKYVKLLVRALGPRLHYPPSFIGRGDMSRGGLLLRSARAQTELDYSVLEPGAVRRGRRPPELEPLPSSRPSTGRQRLRLERLL